MPPGHEGGFRLLPHGVVPHPPDSAWGRNLHMRSRPPHPPVPDLAPPGTREVGELPCAWGAGPSPSPGAGPCLYLGPCVVAGVKFAWPEVLSEPCAPGRRADSSSRSAAGTCCTPRHLRAGGRAAGSRNPGLAGPGPGCWWAAETPPSPPAALLTQAHLPLHLPHYVHLFIRPAGLQGASAMRQVWFRPQGQMQIRNKASFSELASSSR